MHSSTEVNINKPSKSWCI